MSDSFQAQFHAALAAVLADRERADDARAAAADAAKAARAAACPTAVCLPASAPAVWPYTGEPKERADAAVVFGRFEYEPRLGRGSGWPEF